MSHHRGFTRFVLIADLALIGAGCASSSVPAVRHEKETRFWALLLPYEQDQFLREHYDRARLRERVGPPTIDDGEEWVYVGKFDESRGINADMLMAITATLDDPTWKMVVVTFGQDGAVERIRVTTLASSVGEQQRRGIILGVYYDRQGRMRTSPKPEEPPIAAPSAPATAQSPSAPVP